MSIWLSLPQGGFHLGDGDLHTPEICQHALRFLDRLLQRLSIRRAPTLDLPSQIPRCLRARTANGQRTFVRFDELKDL